MVKILLAASLLLSFSVNMITQANAIPNNCVWHYGHCLSSCPSGYSRKDSICKYSNPSLLNLEFNLEFLNSSNFNTIQPSNKLNQSSFPILTRTRGLFFQKTSRVALSQKIFLSAIFTIQLWQVIIDPGEILTSLSNNLLPLIKVFADNSNLNVKYEMNELSEYWINEWMNLAMIFEFLPGDEMILTFYINGLMNRQTFHQKFLLLETSFVLGQENKPSFSGFLYKFIVNNNHYADLNNIDLPLCVFKLEEKCKDFVESGDVGEDELESCCME